MSTTVGVVEVEDLAEWDALVGGTSEATGFHSSAWLSATAREFGDQLRLLMIESDDSQFAVAVACSEGRLLSPRIGYGGALRLAGDVAPLPLGAVRAMEKQLSASFLRVVDAPRARSPWTPGPGMQLLSSSTREVEPRTVLESISSGSVHRSIRGALSTADRFGVSVSDLSSADMGEIYEVYVSSMQRVEATHLARRDFLESIIAQGSEHCWAVGARAEGRLVAFSLFLRSRRNLMHWIAAYSWPDRHLMPNQAILRAVIRRCVEANISVLNLGASHTSAIDEAKARWGGTPVQYAIWSRS